MSQDKHNQHGNNPQKPGHGGTDRPDQGGKDHPGHGGTDRPDQGGKDHPGHGGTDRPDQGGKDRPGQGRPGQGHGEPGNKH